MFDLTTAEYVHGMWMDEEGNRITENDYNRLLSASTWNDDSEDDRADYMHPAQMEAAMDALGLDFYPEDMTFAEYVSGIKF